MSELVSRNVPARSVPVPTTGSPELQRSIAVLAQAALLPMDAAAPANAAEWRAFIARNDAQSLAAAPLYAAAFPHQSVTREIDGVLVREITPKTYNAKKPGLILHFHGGGYAMNGGEASTGEAVMAAHYSGLKAISVDYRMPPDHPFPAAVDDAVAVYSALIKERAPGSIGVLGTSAGGGLTLALALKLKQLGLPLPGALAPSTPWTDLTGASDSYRVNENVDGVFSRYDGPAAGMAALYAAGRPLTDPLISPIFGEFAGFPPTILTTGTRDILLSDTVRLHRKLRAAGVLSQLEVHEAMSHAEYIYAYDAPESAVVFQDIAAFFAAHLRG
jgi:epsilon-lactone hydrolase